MAVQVSVVLPAFNAEETIGAALRSVATQTARPAEVIVVDDDSSDRTREVAIEALPTARILRQERGGPSLARNRGLAQAGQPWTAFLDADDLWHPRKLEDQVRAASHHPDAVLVASDWARGEPVGSPEAVRETVLGHGQLLSLNRFQTSTVLAKTTVLVDLGGFDSTLDGVEDWDLWLRASGRGPIVKLDWPYVGYRDLSDSYSKDTWRVYDRMCAMFEREAQLWEGRRRDLESLLAWHHLRFALAFWLAHERDPGLAVLRRLRAEGLGPQVPRAVARYLLPFLAWRLARHTHLRRPRHLTVPGAPTSNLAKL